MSTEHPQTTERRLLNARRLLEGAGWAVLPPVPRPRKPMADQCEYPDQAGALGNCCTNLTRRLRQTSKGTMWLCSGHFEAAEHELFREAVNAR